MEFTENNVINFSKELKFRGVLDNNVKNFPKIVLIMHLYIFLIIYLYNFMKKSICLC